MHSLEHNDVLQNLLKMHPITSVVKNKKCAFPFFGFDSIKL